TMGDPAGIGPELVAKVLADPGVWQECRPVVIGDPEVMANAAALANAPMRLYTVDSVHSATLSFPEIAIIPPAGLRVGEVPVGRVDPAMGRAAGLCLTEAMRLATRREVDGLLSAPVNKQALYLAGYHYADELELLAHLAQVESAYMAAVFGPVWTVCVANHIPFRQVVEHVKCSRIVGCVNRLHELLAAVGRVEPKIAVAALNPHGGEGGLCGREEVDEIEPAVVAARAQGLSVYGPVPADTVFARALRGEFDGVVCMYHDQAGIARKLLPSKESATLFIGLPVPCGTTSHGTAFDLAGKGIADATSLRTALHYTVLLARGRT
ncbi:MAG: 4-hydroxythreonine-4-phosphate dehydrogenase PdxA, partial [Anaerolineae bacterium]|nr:4-hydroxythreonine-4-phosphate dehydrogenase PdxA [Anaerolineae bacterium]